MAKVEAASVKVELSPAELELVRKGLRAGITYGEYTDGGDHEARQLIADLDPSNWGAERG